MPAPTSASEPSDRGGLLSDLKIIWHMAVTRGKGETHEQRLDNFYSGQASSYDSFRKRLLHGKQDLFGRLPAEPGGTWVDLGAGTGENAENWGDRLGNFSNCYLVDLSSSLLKIAEARVEKRGWQNVRPVHADATQFVPPTGQVDLVTMSYSLTMIPDWFAALDQAWKILKPGGHIGIVDFFVSRKFAPDGQIQHPWGTRHFWRGWFATDNVYLSWDHIPYLQRKFETVHLGQHRGKVPYMPLVRAPYFVFVGRKPETPDASP